MRWLVVKTDKKNQRDERIRIVNKTSSTASIRRHPRRSPGGEPVIGVDVFYRKV
jgi:hypothetical protein